MSSKVGGYFRAARLARGLTLEALARLTGFADARKVAARIARFEQEGIIKDELLARLADALDIDLETVEALVAQDAAHAFPTLYVVQRDADGQYLTPEYLCWSPAVQHAQKCDLDEARAIRAWLSGIGISATISELASD
jgi:transcriptional regulator with XRE-family HTH domain